MLRWMCQGASHGVSQGVKQFSEEIEDIITLYHFARQTDCNCFLFFGDPKLKWGIAFRVQWIQTFNASSHGVGARLLRNPRWRLAVMASRALWLSSTKLEMFWWTVQAVRLYPNISLKTALSIEESKVVKGVVFVLLLPNITELCPEFSCTSKMPGFPVCFQSVAGAASARRCSFLGPWRWICGGELGPLAASLPGFPVVPGPCHCGISSYGWKGAQRVFDTGLWKPPFWWIQV